MKQVNTVKSSELVWHVAQLDHLGACPPVKMGKKSVSWSKLPAVQVVGV